MTAEEWEEMKRNCNDAEEIGDTYVPFYGMIDSRIINEDIFIAIFNAILSTWTERPQLGRDYSDLSLKFYDGTIGYVISEGNECYKNKITQQYWACPVILQFLEQWKYDGILYRVINAPLSKIRVHKMIASWTKDINAFDCFDHLYKNEKYSFIVAKTNNCFGFDVNKYRELIEDRHFHTEHEKEVIFPMDNNYIIDRFYGTLEEFKKHVKNKRYD